MYVTNQRFEFRGHLYITEKISCERAVLSTPLFFSFRLTDHIQITHLALHRIGVNLTHVPAPVRLPDLFYVQIPRLVLAVSHSDPVVLSDHVTVDGEDGLRVHAQPCHLEQMLRSQMGAMQPAQLHKTGTHKHNLYHFIMNF